uniref:type I protein arginine methyltransferase n=1 Tax=Globodera pallida TaxID=36090 RepID=A0A183BVD5_GLOPA
MKISTKSTNGEGITVIEIAQLERQQTLKLPTSSDGFDLVLNDEIEQQRAAFWAQQTFHGVTLGVVQQPALDELFRQPWCVKGTVAFERDPVERLHRIQVPFTMNAQRTCHVHGVASWFDVAFVGSKRTVWLLTAPTEPLTHWYQVRCLVKQPMLVLAGQDVRGRLEMVANDKQSYDMELEMRTLSQVPSQDRDVTGFLHWGPACRILEKY